MSSSLETNASTGGDETCCSHLYRCICLCIGDNKMWIFAALQVTLWLGIVFGVITLMGYVIPCFLPTLPCDDFGTTLRWGFLVSFCMACLFLIGLAIVGFIRSYWRHTITPASATVDGPTTTTSFSSVASNETWKEQTETQNLLVSNEMRPPATVPLSSPASVVEGYASVNNDVLVAA
jgi:hypothetical protein